MSNAKRVFGCLLVFAVIGSFTLYSTNTESDARQQAPLETADPQRMARTEQTEPLPSRFIARPDLTFSQVNAHKLMEDNAWVSPSVVRLQDGPDGWPRPWTAVAFSGTMRSFKYPALLDSLRNNLLAALGGTILIFSNSRLEDWPRSGLGCANSQEDLFDALRDLLPGKAEHFVVWRSFQVPDPMWTHNCASRPSLIQSLSVLDSYSLVLDYENQVGVKFDWIVRARPDVGFPEPLPSLASLNESVFVPGNSEYQLSNQFALVPRKYSDVFFQLPPREIECAVENDNDRLRLWLDTNNTPYYRHKAIHFTIVRAYYGAECFRSCNGFGVGSQCELRKVCEAMFGEITNDRKSKKVDAQLLISELKTPHAGCSVSLSSPAPVHLKERKFRSRTKKP